MKAESRKFLEKLLSSIGPSGFEIDTAKVWIAEAKKFADEVVVDSHGNVDAIINKGGSPRVMLAGHIDEIGFMVTHIDSNGFLFFQPIGGWDPQVLVGQRVWVKGKKDRVLGVIGKKPIHLMEAKDRTNASKIDGLWIDIGAKDQADAEKVIEIGDPGVLAWGVEELRNGLLVSRGMDDRIGAFIALEAGRMIAKTRALKPQAEIHCVATVQEEVGLRGAKTAAYGIDPVMGIAIDVTFATDHPHMGSTIPKIRACDLGGGPVISRGANINHKVYDLLVKTAKSKKIKWQPNPAPRGTGTDANAIQLSRSGVAAGLIGVPNRYMHSPCEVVSIKDVDNIIKLLAHTLCTVTPRTNFKPY